MWRAGFTTNLSRITSRVILPLVDDMEGNPQSEVKLPVQLACLSGIQTPAELPLLSQ